MLSEATLARLLEFREQRDWRQFHTFRNLAVSLSLEAAELLEFTQWVPEAQMERVVAARKAEIAAEIADIAIYLQFLAHDLGLDLERCVRDKLAVNEARYPVDKARGRSTKYDRLD
ncbi:MAG: nucleotide pyrophosphohydrolase [Burkholderiales bacterium]|nr:nucleotide pyrophosphohydrolase [Burkholderiales bacterium]